MPGMNRGNSVRLRVQKMLAGVTLAVGAATALPAAAEPANARLFKAQFGYMPSCNACHSDGGGSPLNPYGKAFKEARANATAFAAIASADADGDGFSNQEEVAAKANPGDSDSTPDKPGNWLDMSQLIPKQVQKAFPDARLYKPIDAILTDTERSKAQAWGVTLDKDDENTIYVPVVERKPVGTAVIVRGQWEEQAYFLLVTTDRQLALAQIIPVAGDMLPEPESDLYRQWQGATAAQFNNGSTEPLAVHVALTVHKALALIEARLKK